MQYLKSPTINLSKVEFFCFSTFQIVLLHISFYLYYAAEIMHISNYRVLFKRLPAGEILKNPPKSGLHGANRSVRRVRRFQKTNC